MLHHQLKLDLEKVLKTFDVEDADITLSIPEKSHFGDYSTNVALQLSKQNIFKHYQSAREVANKVIERFGCPEYIERVEVAGPGFINFFLKDEVLIESLVSAHAFVIPASSPVIPAKAGIYIDKDTWIPGQARDDKGKRDAKRYLVEYAQPNTHKAFHIGHLRNITIGESLSRLLESKGHMVFRATYDGDIGPHVAKAIWGILHKFKVKSLKLKVEVEKLKQKSLKERAQFLGQAYALGATAYEKDPSIKAEIDEINAKLYKREDQELVSLWQETRQWSFDYFDEIYHYLGTKFDRVFPESEVEAEGTRIVKENLGKVFVSDQGAVIFPGQRYGLHNRVFITSRGYPTYEAKEVGLAFAEYEASKYDFSLHVVANEQAEYFKVVFKAIDLIDPLFKGRKKHISHGMVNLKSGKMSSRTGEVVTADDLIDQVKHRIIDKIGDKSGVAKDEKVLDQVAVGAIKFSMLKVGLTRDIAFDIDESISLHGDSGPYLQYTFARARSLLANPAAQQELSTAETTLEEDEKSVLRMAEYFNFIADKAANELNPTMLCEYLIDLAKIFNLFYERNSVIGSTREGLRLSLTKHVGDILRDGLALLGIESPERM